MVVGRSLPLFSVLATLVANISYADVYAARNLRIGDILSAKDILFDGEKKEYVEENFIGKEVRKIIYKGRLVHERDVHAERVIFRNEIISIYYNFNGLGIRAEGRALGSAGVGEVIDVMNVDSRVTIKAIVTGAGNAMVLK